MNNGIEDPGQLFFGVPDAAVGHRDHHGFASHLDREPDLAAVGRAAGCVVEQLADDLRKAHRVALYFEHAGWRVDAQPLPTRIHAGPAQINRGLDEAGDFDLLAFEGQLRAAAKRCIEQVADPLRHVRGLPLDEGLRAGRQRLVGAGTAQLRRCNPDRCHRVAQFLRDHAHELRLSALCALCGGLQLLGFEHGQNQLFVRLLQMGLAALVIGVGRLWMTRLELGRRAGRRHMPIAFARMRVGLENASAQPLPFGVVHRRVRSLDQREGIVAVVGVDADADARRHAKHVIADVAGGADEGDHLVGHQDRVRSVRHLGQQDQELITAVAADRVRGPHRRRKATRQPLERLVANGVTERVVDLLEVVQVHEQKPQARAVPPRDGNRAGEPIEQQHAIGQLRQCIEAGRLRCFIQRLCGRFDVALVAQRGNHQLFIRFQQLRDFAAALMLLCRDDILQQADQHGAHRHNLPIQAGQFASGVRHRAVARLG